LFLMDTSALAAWINEDFVFRATLVIAGMMLFASGPPLVLAWFLWRVGSRTVAAGRYPPPGIRLLQDMPVVTGSAARQRGRLLKVFSTSIATAALVIALILLRFAFMVWTR
jgi:hypothetical protein